MVKTLAMNNFNMTSKDNSEEKRLELGFCACCWLSLYSLLIHTVAGANGCSFVLPSFELNFRDQMRHG